MAINLFSLNASQATLIKPEGSTPFYKISTDKIKADLKANSKDLLQTSNEGVSYENTISLDGLKFDGELKRTYSNYSKDVFFRKDMPQVMTDGGYMVSGVKFSKEELEQCRMVMKAAADGIGNGVGNIDYENYARMGIAISGVKSFASEKLTEEQAQVVNKAMQEYNEALINAEKEIMSGDDYVDSNYENLSDYYGKAHVFNDGEIEALNNLKKELGRITGREYRPTQKGDTAVVQSATNQKLISEITNLFANADISDEQEMNDVMEKYKALMKPAYTAYGMNDSHGSLTRVLNDDVAEFRKQMASITAAAKYQAVSYSV